ncbi:MAG: Wzz/FepE/Etk N-terminal domain-containing protein, partial [Candidatus Binataceae bacterium]
MAQPDVKIRPAPRFDEDDGGRGRAPGHYENDTVDLTPYVQAIRRRAWTIALGAVVAAAVTAVITGLLLPRWYRATAVIRPISTPAIESRIAGVLGGLGGGFAGGLGGLAASLGAGGNNDAEEYIAILEGFQFNVALVERHRLAELVKPGRLSLLFAPNPRDPNWMTYRVLKKRFECEYSIKTGNITLDFQARNRRDA